MPKLTRRRERFCRHYALYANAAQAAREAGYAAVSCRQHGHRLLRDPRIQARLAEIEAEMGRQAEAGAERWLGKLETVYRRAVAEQRFGAAVYAVALQARLARRHAAEAPFQGAAPFTAAPKPPENPVISPVSGLTGGRKMMTNDDK